MSRVAINTGAIANDGTGDTLRSAGGIINDNFLELYSYLGAGSTNILSAPMWNTTTSGINTLRNVGIGTTNPRFILEVGSVGTSGTSLWVNGDVRITGILTVGSSSITFDGSSNTIRVGSGITINGNSGIISATAINLGGTTLTGAAVTYITARIWHFRKSKHRKCNYYCYWWRWFWRIILGINNIRYSYTFKSWYRNHKSNKHSYSQREYFS